MSRTTRAAIATALTLAFAAVPLVADWCAASCDASRASAATAAPACHRAASPGARVGREPAPCGHGHHPMVVDAAAITARLSPAPGIGAPAAIDVTRSAITEIAAVGIRAGPTIRPSRAPLALALSSALRI